MRIKLSIYLMHSSNQRFQLNVKYTSNINGIDICRHLNNIKYLSVQVMFDKECSSYSRQVFIIYR